MLRIATIGTSVITNDFIEVVHASDRASFVGTLSRDADRAERFTREHGGTRPFTDLGELAAADDVDAVYVASPNACHHAQALACIAAGKHVLVEKPIGANAREAREIFAAAARAGVVALEAMRPVHDPALHAIRAHLGELGPVRRVNLRLGKYSSRYGDLLAGRGSNIFTTAMAAGALMDIGVYPVEVLVELFGAPSSIVASPVMLADATRPLTGGPLDGAGVIVGRYPTMVAVLEYSKITNDDLPCQIEGEDATLLFEGASVPVRARINDRGTVTRSAAKAVRSAAGASTRELTLPQSANTMAYELSDFLDAVKALKQGSTWEEAAAGPFGTLGHFREVTCSTMDILDEARRQAGIVFPSDDAKERGVR